MATFIADSVITTLLQGVMQQPAGLTGTYWSSIVPGANINAYNDIISRLAMRGYSPTQIAAWDRAVEFNTDLGLFWALVKGAGLSKDAYDRNKIKELDRRLELYDPKNPENSVAITTNGALVFPANDFTITTGLIDTGEDLFPGYCDPDDSRIGNASGPQF